MPSLTLELRGFHLANRDLFSKSDPYFVISKQTSFGGWIPIRTSETVKNDLNPVWRRLTLLAQELPREGEKLRFEVYDDDGKLGPDASDHLIGDGFFSLEELEKAFDARMPLPILKRENARGFLIFTQVHRSQAPAPPPRYPPPRKHSAASPHPPPAQSESETPLPQYPPNNIENLTTPYYSGGGFILPGIN